MNYTRHFKYAALVAALALGGCTSSRNHSDDVNKESIVDITRKDRVQQILQVPGKETVDGIVTDYICRRVEEGKGLFVSTGRSIEDIFIRVTDKHIGHRTVYIQREVPDLAPAGFQKDDKVSVIMYNGVASEVKKK
jgi:hypothetical protein